MFRARLIVSGSVQGVGYRSFVKRIALMFKINGYVRNMLDGTVEIVVETPDKRNLEDFKNKIAKNAVAGSFDDISVENIAIATLEEVQNPQFTSFEIKL